jgi:hypothetical protein
VKVVVPAIVVIFATSALSPQSSVIAGRSPTVERLDVSLQANNFLDALLKISAEFKFPLAVEWVKSAETLRPVRFFRKRASAADVIQAVVADQPGYDWRTEDGVMHVFHRDLVKDSRNPLNITVKEFG